MQADPGRQRQDNIGDGCAVRSTLVASVREGLRVVRGENATLNRMNLLATLLEALLKDRLLDTAIDDADGDPFTCGAGITQEAIRRQQGKDLFKDVARVGRRRVVHDRISPAPVTVSSSWRKFSTRRMQCWTAGGPWRTAKTRTASASRKVSAASTVTSLLALR